MAEITYRNENTTARSPRADWSAIWKGVFTFIAIWSVFGLLGMAIFASAANPDATRPGMGMSVGIWTIVLTIIAMYIAGRETGRLAAVGNRLDGLLHGMIMFGLSVVAALVLAVIGGSNMSSGPGAPTGTHNLLGVFVNLGWTGFLSLFLGWLAAMGGASTGAQHRGQPGRAAQQIRPAA